MREPRTSAESMRAGRLARDKVRNGGGEGECRFLSPSGRRWEGNDKGATAKYWKKPGWIRGDWVYMEGTLDEVAGVFPVCTVHVPEFGAAPVVAAFEGD